MVGRPSRGCSCQVLSGWPSSFECSLLHALKLPAVAVVSCVLCSSSTHTLCPYKTATLALCLSVQDKAKVICPNHHHVLTAAHPSGLSANRGFFGCRHFSKANELLQQEGREPIDWQIE